MYPAGKEGFRIIPGFALDILRQAERDRTGFRRVGQHAHGVDAGAHQLFRTGDAIPVFTHRAKRVVSGNAEIVALFDLLQHRVRLAGRKHIARQQQQRDAVGGRGGGSGNHVRRAGANGGGAGNNLTTQGLSGKTGGDMRHPLLVTPLIDPHFTAILFKGLAHSQHVAVAKDSKDAFDELMLFAIDFQVLVIQELHQRLRHCQSQFAHVAQSLLFSICVWVRVLPCPAIQAMSQGNR